MTYGSLFTGIGGLDLGLDRAGFECKWQVEIDPYALKVLERHWPNVTRYGDITKLRGDELEPVDLMCGGFPCQDLSQAGKQVGIEGSRSGLWFEYARLVGILRPRYVLIENVPGLLIHDAMRRVIGELARLGYVGIWRSLRASEFGASHLRKRVFIVAYAQNGNGWPGIHGEHRAGWREAADRSGGDSADMEAFAPGPSDPRWPDILRERPDLAPALENGIRRGTGMVANSECARLATYTSDAEPTSRPAISPNHAECDSGGDWMGSGKDSAPPQSPLCRMVDGIPPPMDGDPMSNRTKRLGRLGNAVVPQISEWIGHRITEFESNYA